jgi:hypothetical protein
MIQSFRHSGGMVTIDYLCIPCQLSPTVGLHEPSIQTEMVGSTNRVSPNNDGQPV